MIEDLLRRYDLRLDTEQGQHFVDDETLLRREVDEADLDGDETVLEIGSGLGTLTKAIARQAGHVIAVERDARLIDALEQETSGFETIEIIEGDILEIDWPAFDVCISNPPYEISADLIERLGKAGNLSVRPREAVPAGERLRDRGRGGVFHARPGAFHPQAQEGPERFRRCTPYPRYHQGPGQGAPGRHTLQRGKGHKPRAQTVDRYQLLAGGTAMTKHCDLCGDGLETDEEIERELCDDCLHDGFNQLGEALARLKKKHRG